MMKKRITGVLLGFALTGCAGSQSVGLTVDGEFQRVIMGDNQVSEQIAVEDISSTDIDGHTQGIVRVKNQGSSDFDIQYRFYWYDAVGLEVSLKPSAWKHRIIHGGDMVSLSEVSISPKGKEFRVQIREYSN